jgi:hypothetical protein
MEIKAIEIRSQFGNIAIQVVPSEGETADEAFTKAQDWVNTKAKELDGNLVTKEEARKELEEEIKKSLTEKILAQLLVNSGGEENSDLSKSAFDSAGEIYNEPVSGDSELISQTTLAAAVTDNVAQEASPAIIPPQEATDVAANS